jgi:superfamily II DNA or RNA helicase
MPVLHAIWHQGHLHLWGEIPLGENRSSAAEVCADAGLDADAVADHPSALDGPELHAVVGELSADGLLASIAEDSSLDLWLPADGGGPVPSRSTDAAPPPHSDLALRRFRVPTLKLGPAEAGDMLASLPEPPPRACGSTVHFWAVLARYVLGQLSRKQFVPDVEEVRGAEPRALWRMVVTHEEERAWLVSLAGCLPPVCRAAMEDPRACDELTLLEGFIQSVADATIRRALAADPFFQQIHERAAAPNAAPEVRWLAALLGDSPAWTGPQDERIAFVNHVRAWLGRLHESGREVPTKLCFELCEPEDYEDDDFDLEGEVEAKADATPELSVESGAQAIAEEPRGSTHWRLRYLLQDLDATGRLHDVSAVWHDEGTTSTLLRRRFATRREQLVADLTRAAEVFPPIGESLKQESPCGVELSAVEAHTFMRDGAPLLEARGFGVRLPEWATKPERRLGLRLFVAPAEAREAGITAPARLGLGSLVEFEWRVAVGDEDLTVEEFERLCAAKSSVIRLRGEWILVEPETAQAAAEFLARQRQGRMTLGEALRAAAGASDTAPNLPVIGVRGTEWIAQLLEGMENIRMALVPQPGDFVGAMRPYQLRGLAWLRFMEQLGLGACLADDMGLGKTIQLIALLLSEKEHGEADGPTLIFTPMSVVGNWHREFEHFAPRLKVFVHHGPERLTGDAFVSAVQGVDAVITTYALGHRDLDTLQKVPWRRIVLDEAQKVKNPSAAQTIAIRNLHSVHRAALTGTPLENHLSELWSIMEMINPGLLGSAADFRKRFAVPVERLGDQNRAAQLKTLIRPFVLRRVKTDPAVQNDLPDKMEMRVFCNLTVEQAALYEQVTAAALAEIERASGIRRRGVILAALTRLKQICNHPGQYLRDGGGLDGRSGKCERLVEMLEEVLAEGDGALVFTQFREMGELLVRLLSDRLHHEVLFLHGGTSARQRAALIDRFQDPRRDVRLFVLSLRAGGLGLNLTAANHVFHFDRWWNPAVEEQATDRAYRIGQTRRVQVHKFVCIGTIEDRIDRMLTEKTALADRIVGAGDDWLTSLSTEELRKYFTLSHDAVGEE